MLRRNGFRKKNRLAHASQPGKVNAAWGVRLKRGALGGQAGRNLEKTFKWSNTVKPLERGGRPGRAISGFKAHTKAFPACELDGDNRRKE
jgi:hypothetical protein